MARFMIYLKGGAMLVLKNGKLVLIPPCDPEPQAALDMAAVMVAEARSLKGAARKKIEAAALGLVEPHTTTIEKHVERSTARV